MTVRQIKREFMQQAKLGNGRAYSIFMQNPKIDFTDCITELSLHNFGYDPQCEGDRADYALQFIRELEEYRVYDWTHQSNPVFHRLQSDTPSIWKKFHYPCYRLVRSGNEPGRQLQPV